jgi:hypothetical protein
MENGLSSEDNSRSGVFHLLWEKERITVTQGFTASLGTYVCNIFTVIVNIGALLTKYSTRLYQMKIYGKLQNDKKF